MTLRAWVALAGIVLLAGAAASRAPAAPNAAPGAADSFGELARRAAEARDRGRLDEAASLYREAVKVRPGWTEGWWFLGTMAYEADRATECRESFDRFIAADAEVGPAWGLRGLCAFEDGDYEAATRDLLQAVALGPVDDEPLWRVVAYHRVLLELRAGRFEQAIPTLTELARVGGASGEITTACGLLLLRRSMLPDEVPPGDASLVQLAGRAECAALAGHRGEAEARFAELMESHPRERHVHYAYGLFLAGTGSREAIAAYRQEIALHPDHVLAHVELAFNLLTHGRPGEARSAAEAAIRLDPDLFAAHFALGRAAVETGDLTLGVFELEAAARLAPGSPEIQLALARAYARAGRGEDAARANRRFQELDSARRAANQAP